MYSEEEETPQITEIVDRELDFDFDLEDRPLDPYLEL